MIITSYKLSFILQLGGIFINLITFYFISKLVGDAASGHLQKYGGNYFQFVLIGVAFSGYLTSGLYVFSSSLRREQMMGTLEAMLTSPTKLWVIIVSNSLWNFIYGSLIVLIYLCYGMFLGVDFSSANVLSVVVVIVLTIFVFSGIGILSSSFIMIFKRGDPITSLISMGSSILGGVYFPITLFPKYIQTLSHFVPLFYSLKILRLALIKGYSINYFYSEILILLLFTAFFFPLGILLFKFAVKRAKIDGSLIHY